MTGPLSQYVDTNIPVVGDIEREYGSNLEGMSNMEKIYLAQDIAKELYRSKVWSEPPDKVWQLAIRIRTGITLQSDAIALLKYLANSIGDGDYEGSGKMGTKKNKQPLYFEIYDDLHHCIVDLNEVNFIRKHNQNTEKEIEQGLDNGIFLELYLTGDGGDGSNDVIKVDGVDADAIWKYFKSQSLNYQTLNGQVEGIATGGENERTTS